MCVCHRISSSLVLFFFSSRRRHTRLQGDWSSDVCSSDLNYKVWDGFARAEVNTSERLVDFKILYNIEIATEMPQAGYKCGIVGYVEDKETFVYQKVKTAKKFLIDSCGFKQWMVYWPGSDGRFPKEVEELQVGSIIVAVITKTDLTKGFSIRKLDVIRKLPEKEK